MVQSWWRRPTWSPYAALTWSVLYGVLALGWALGAVVAAGLAVALEGRRPSRRDGGLPPAPA